MRVLYINVNCKYTSTGKIVYDLYAQCRKDGHEAAVCYGRGPLVEEPGIYKFGLDWETNLHALLTRLTGLNACWSFFSTRRLLKFLDQFQPDVVHLHELHGYFLNLKPLYAYLSKHNIPVVHTFHCEFAYTGKCGHAFACEKWKTGCGNCPQVKKYPTSFFFDFTKRMHRQKRLQWESLHRAVITTPSRWLAERVEQSFLGGRDIRIVKNGIDVHNLFYPHDARQLRAEHGLTDEKVVLSVAPRLMGETKGGAWIVQLAQMLKNENIRFFMIGIDDLKEKFPDNVVPMGRITDQEKLATYYSMADCFLICSEKETFSMTCAESLCCGTPIAGFCAGAPETIFMPPQALFVPYGDLDALEDILRKQLNGSFNRAELAENMQKLYSVDCMYQQFKAIYQELNDEV